MTPSPGTPAQPMAGGREGWPHWVRAWVPVALGAGLIFVLSSIPGDQIDLPSWSHLDKLLHAGIYGLLALLTLRALKRTTRRGLFTRGLVAVGIVLLYGVADELHQLFVPGRSADPLDVVADLIGALMALLLSYLGGRLTPGRAPSQTR